MWAIFSQSAENPSWFNAALKTLSDILDEDWIFLHFPEIRKKYKIKTNLLRYFGLCNTIPKYWKEAFNRDFESKSNSMEQSTHPLNISFFFARRRKSVEKNDPSTEK